MTDAVGPTFAVPNPLYPGSVVLWAGAPDAGPPRLSPGFPPPGPAGAAFQTPAFALERLLVLCRPDRDGGRLLTDDASDVDRLADQELFGP
jgi:hypothetical protein